MALPTITIRLPREAVAELDRRADEVGEIYPCKKGRSSVILHLLGYSSPSRDLVEAIGDPGAAMREAIDQTTAALNGPLPGESLEQTYDRLDKAARVAWLKTLSQGDQRHVLNYASRVGTIKR